MEEKGEDTIFVVFIPQSAFDVQYSHPMNQKDIVVYQLHKRLPTTTISKLPK